MPIELEAKFKVESHDAVRACLHSAEATRAGCVMETNHIFDDASQTLLAGGRGLRLREYQAIDGCCPQTTLTFKGPRQPGEFKNREEIECSVDPPQAGLDILRSLGFIERICFQKKRESWRLDVCNVELDEVPHLGCFVEIEGPDEQAIRRAQKTLSLDDAEMIKQSYVALLVEYAEKHQLPVDRITFE
jgi:predicted adenylyl cyclase CyaB